MEHEAVDVLRRLQTAEGAEIVLGAVGDEPGAYVVGGAVRDALLDRTPRELDVVIEGDAVAVARRAAARLGGKLTIHERFGTATVALDGFAFDLASARRERYERPGALPTVEPDAPLSDDLARRDFTVNAIAVHLADGALTEFPGARADLGQRLLRVLHDRSFIDDPTRMLRLARYEARLDFRADPHTAALIDPALLATVSPERAGRELRLALREPSPAAALRALERHGLAQQMFGPGFRVPEHAPHGGDLALAASTTAVDDLEAKLDALGFPAAERRAVTAAATAPQRIAKLADDASDSAIWLTFRRERPEAAEYLAFTGSKAAARWLDHVRHRRLALTGDDLIAAGLSGAAVGAGLEAATLAMLDGRAEGRADQLAAAIAKR